MNDYYKIAIIKAKVVERGFEGTAYSGQEELLRQSQRAWLPVRDTTCELAVSFGALIEVAGSAERLSSEESSNEQDADADDAKKGHPPGLTPDHRFIGPKSREKHRLIDLSPAPIDWMPERFGWS